MQAFLFVNKGQTGPVNFNNSQILYKCVMNSNCYNKVCVHSIRMLPIQLQLHLKGNAKQNCKRNL